MMKGIMQKVVCLALVVVVVNINAARASKPQAAAVAAQAAQVAQTAVAAVAAASQPVTHEVASQIVHVIAGSVVCASCAEGPAAQVSLQDGLEASFATAVEDAVELVTIDAANDAVDVLEADMNAHNTVAHK